MALENNLRLRISSQALARQVGEELVLLDLASGTYFGLNPVGSRIWALLDQVVSIDEICQRLEAEYDVTPEILRDDVESLLMQLLEKGLVLKD